MDCVGAGDERFRSIVTGEGLGIGGGLDGLVPSATDGPPGLGAHETAVGEWPGMEGWYVAGGGLVRRNFRMTRIMRALPVVRVAICCRAWSRILAAEAP